MRMTPDQVAAFREQTMNKGPKNPALAALAPAASGVPQPRPTMPGAMPMANNAARMANDSFIGLDRFLSAPQPAPTVRGVNAPFVSGDPNLRALRTYIGGM
jgi:hypothetical protein